MCFFWNILSVFFFLVVGYLVMSWHQVLDISISHFFIPASCSEPAKVRTESVRNILRFQNPKMAPQFISKNGREKYVNFVQFWFGLSGARVLHEHVWSLLTGFEVKKNTQNFAFPQGHFLKAGILSMSSVIFPSYPHYVTVDVSVLPPSRTVFWTLNYGLLYHIISRCSPD